MHGRLTKFLNGQGHFDSERVTLPRIILLEVDAIAGYTLDDLAGPRWGKVLEDGVEDWRFVVQGSENVTTAGFGNDDDL